MASERARVAVVDDDEWFRRGIADGLRELSSIQSVKVVTHKDAFGQPDLWPEVDLVIVGSGWDDSAWDHHVGVREARSIRCATSDGARPTVVARLSGHMHEVAQIRLLEAGVNAIWPKDHVRDPTELAVALEEVKKNPPHVIAYYQSPAVRCLGVTAKSRINDGIDHIEQNELTDLFEGDASTRYSRRQLITLRTRLTELMCIEPVSSGSCAVVNRAVPSWRQLQTLMHLARGSKLAK